MNNPIVAFTKILPALAMACALAVTFAEPATAQTAKKLKCTGCVKSKQIKNEAITGKDIKNGAVGGADLANNAVNSAKIADGSVGTADLGGNSVTSAKIADGTVGNADLADNAVDSAKVVNDSLTTSDLAADSVGASELGNNAVGSANVIDNSLTSADIQNNSLTSADLGANSVGSSEVTDNSLTSIDLGSSSVGSSEVASNSIPATDQSNEAGVDFVGGNGFDALTATAAAYESVTISNPSSGFVIVTASGSFQLNTNSTADWAGCSISTSATTFQSANQVYARESVVDAMLYVPFSSTRVFSVAAGSASYHLVCQTFQGTGGVFDTYLTALFVPTRY